jgi:hypothetical protein
MKHTVSLRGAAHGREQDEHPSFLGEAGTGVGAVT